jgi:FkbM family methyltransferase
VDFHRIDVHLLLPAAPPGIGGSDRGMATNRIRKTMLARRESTPFYWWRRFRRSQTIRIDGFVVEVDQRQIGRTATKALWRGTYEEAERFLVRRALKPGDRVIEAGAGLGIVTMNIAKIVGAENVIVYEASPLTADLLERNLKRNGFAVEVRRRGLSDTDKGERFVHSRNVRASSSVAFPEGFALDIPTDDISRVVEEFRPNTLVLDIEGKEIDVLRGPALAKVDKVIVEIHPRQIGDAAYVPFYRTLLDAGFLIRHELSIDNTLLFERA